MSQSIDVGTVLGGRYKVTSSIVESHDGDLVLDGVDQILNRPVSILVSAPNNSEQLAQSAREVATGERPIGIQVLDLGVSHGATYLITNHAAAADLLDLIVAQDAPYVEPFFTDTLGSEIFGEARSREPETYNGLYEHDSNEYIQYEPGEEGQPGAQPAQPSPHGGAVPPPPSAPPQSAHRASAAGIAAAAAAAAATGKAPTPPKVTPWSEAGKAGNAAPTQQRPAAAPSPAQPEPSAEEPATAASPRQPAPGGSGEGRGAAFPAAARQTTWNDPSDRIFDRDDDLEEDDESTRPKSVPWLVGGILALVLIIALIFAFTTLGGVFQPQAASPKATTSHSDVPSQSQSAGQSPPPAPVVAPVIDSVTRLHPEELTFADQFDSKLVNTYDGNPATYWSDMEFAREDWGGFSKSVSLAVKLKDVSDIKSVELDQLGGTGGSVSVYTNAQPDVAGATLVGTNTFNTTQLVFPLPTAVKAQYVIIQITALPRLAAPKTQYPFGLRLAEIKVQ